MFFSPRPVVCMLSNPSSSHSRSCEVNKCARWFTCHCCIFPAHPWLSKVLRRAVMPFEKKMRLPCQNIHCPAVHFCLLSSRPCLIPLANSLFFFLQRANRAITILINYLDGKYCSSMRLLVCLTFNWDGDNYLFPLIRINYRHLAL